MSYWKNPMEAPNSAVSAPISATQPMAVGESAKMKLSRATMYTPAVTMVAAWIKAETGVGPAMASGNHTDRGSWALLPMAPTNNRMPTMASSPKPKSFWCKSRSATPVACTTTWSRSWRKLSVGPISMMASRCSFSALLVEGSPEKMRSCCPGTSAW